MPILTDDELRTAALEPKKAKNEHGEIETHDLDELVAIRKLQSPEARSAWAGVRAARVILPGAQ